MKVIKYRGGYKYQLAEEYRGSVGILPPSAISIGFLTLSTAGVLIIRNGYAWDGPSGPTIDTASSMRGSLVHDALYQLLRAGLLPQSMRERADRELYRICVEDGMWKWRAKLWLREVRKFAGSAADPTHKKRVHTAP